MLAEPRGQDYCPVEWNPAIFSAIQTAVANLRVVVLTAGNGGLNLDDSSRFGSYFDRNQYDSGSIYVGAGDSVTHAPLSFSNYGSRLDVQGWGNNEASLAFGDLFFPNNDERQAYTTQFGGTSGAGALVAGAASLVQSVRRARSLPDLTPLQMRSALAYGATSQGYGVKVGPLPNLRYVISAIPVPAPVVTATGSGIGSAVLTWPGVSGISGYEVFRQDSRTASWGLVATTSSTTATNTGLSAGRTYLFRADAYDGAGNHSPYGNAEIATMLDFADASLASGTPIRAQHLVDLRKAANAICVFAGTAVCPSQPFTGATLDAAQIVGTAVRASDVAAIQSLVTSLRASIGASTAIFHETPTSGGAVRAVHVQDIRTAEQ